MGQGTKKDDAVAAGRHVDMDIEWAHPESSDHETRSKDYATAGGPGDGPEGEWTPVRSVMSNGRIVVALRACPDAKNRGDNTSRNALGRRTMWHLVRRVISSTPGPDDGTSQDDLREAYSVAQMRACSDVLGCEYPTSKVAHAWPVAEEGDEDREKEIETVVLSLAKSRKRIAMGHGRSRHR